MKRALVAIAIAAAASACTNVTPTGATYALSPTVIFSEVLFDPPGTDGNNEFVELQCTPSVPLDSYWLAIIEGDYSTSDVNARGSIWFAKALTGVTCGTNGFVVLQLGHVASGVAGTTYVNNFFTDNLQNGTQTLWLLDTAGATFSDSNNDIDDDNDGVIDDPTLAAKIVDSVAITTGMSTIARIRRRR